MSNPTRTALVFTFLSACGGKGGDTGGGDGGDGGSIDTSTVEGYLSSLGDADLSSAKGQELATSSSAGSVLTFSLAPLYLAGFNKGTCPTLVEEGNRQTYTGGCTDPDGNTWTGSAVSVGDDTSGKVTFEDFGFSGQADECSAAPVSYSVTGTVEGGGTTTQTLDILSFVEFEGPDESCAPMSMRFGFDYEVTLTEGESNQVYEGSGTVGAEGYGALFSTTADEVVADCSSEPDRGTLTATAGGDTLVITFDGATACDDPGQAPATLNGASIGQLEVSSCATAGGRASALLAALAGLALLSGRRRRD